MTTSISHICSCRNGNSTRRRVWLLAVLLLSGCVTTVHTDDVTVLQRSSVDIRRPALWVPDLDRAIVFYRDVLGFSLSGVKELDVKDGSVLLDMFNADLSGTFRRALFSSATTNNALFVMESKGAPSFVAGQPRPAALVIRSDDVAATVARARQHGFTVGNTNIEPATISSKDLLETTIIGPGAQAVLVYQFVDEQ